METSVDVEKAIKQFLKHREANRRCASRYHEKNKDNAEYKTKRNEYYAKRYAKKKEERLLEKNGV